MGIFSDMETGTKIVLLIILVGVVFFSGGNIFKDSGKGGKGNSSGSGGGSGTTPQA